MRAKWLFFYPVRSIFSFNAKKAKKLGFLISSLCEFKMFFAAIWLEDGSDVDISVMETIDFEEQPDEETSFQREIFRFRAIDYDLDTNYDFNLEATGSANYLTN